MDNKQKVEIIIARMVKGASLHLSDFGGAYIEDEVYGNPYINSNIVLGVLDHPDVVKQPNRSFTISTALSVESMKNV